MQPFVLWCGSRRSASLMGARVARRISGPVLVDVVAFVRVAKGWFSTRMTKPYSTWCVAFRST